MEASSITKPSFTDHHHGQQPGKLCGGVNGRRGKGGSKATGDQLQLLYCCGNAQVEWRFLDHEELGYTLNSDKLETSQMKLGGG